MTRPLKRPQEPLNQIINLRITERQKAKLIDIAKAANLTTFEVLRRRIDSAKIPHKEQLLIIDEIRLMRQELARQGGLIKYLYSSTEINPGECAAAVNAQKNIIDKIGKLVHLLEARTNVTEPE